MRTLMLTILAALAAFGAQPNWKAGVARVAITPQEPIWMAGFASRTRPSEGVRQDIYASALALRDESGKTAVVLALDLVGIEREMADEIAGQCRRRYGLERDALVMNVSHTHSGPVAGLVPMPLYALEGGQREVVRRYTARLIEQTVGVVGAAIDKLAPATLSFHQGLAGIAVNRRRGYNRSWPGPVDHDVPLLAVRDASGGLVAMMVGYACHATALNDYLISGDWPGFARAALEKAHPGATMLFIQGCGADSNSLPRKGEELARRHGEVLAAAAEQALAAKGAALAGPLRTAFELVDVPFHDLVTREELERRAASPKPEIRGPAERMLGELKKEGKLPDRYPYPVQVWQFGSGLKFIALGGEVVVDYSLRLKNQYGFESTWVAGYNNDILAYIPSRRVLQEGGYEGRDAMWYFGRPGGFGAAVEEIIVEKVADLVARTR